MYLQEIFCKTIIIIFCYIVHLKEKKVREKQNKTEFNPIHHYSCFQYPLVQIEVHWIM